MINPSNDWRVGFAITSILEKLVKDYIIIHTSSDGKYSGDLNYLQGYQSLKDYNGKNCFDPQI